MIGKSVDPTAWLDPMDTKSGFKVASYPVTPLVSSSQNFVSKKYSHSCKYINRPPRWRDTPSAHLGCPVCTMLFKFSSSDMLNSTLLNTSTGNLEYQIATRPHFLHVKTPYGTTKLVPARRSFLLNSMSHTLASWVWTIDAQPIDIVIGRQKLGDAKELFGCMGPSTS
jgi:hypothetical protein